jgi:hypothetical protein
MFHKHLDTGKERPVESQSFYGNDDPLIAGKGRRATIGYFQDHMNSVAMLVSNLHLHPSTKMTFQP